ncbi:hypothetical protein GOP47_0023350 [Adiantum capillus-veneris]|uniref:Uncharacterized protein n=1 Tax=Adiantum capillus-veneris TaxID=13818 RepID=A0A9D4U3T9_ADICA|nr:hypothetical protein GOP47_0023350 [Adiantum capillus-veneris]
MYLSSLDIFFAKVQYNLRVLFYEQIKPADISEFVGSLKASLAEALVHFYPLAGRLLDDDRGRLVLDCNDAGVDFVEAETAASFRELQDAHFDFTPLFSQLAPLGHLTRSDLPNLPLLAVQITRFLEGGVAVAISHSHIAMDGSSLWQFWVSWGECTQGIPLSKPPIHTRTIFKPANVSHEIAKLIPLEMIPIDITNENSSTPLVNKVLHFSAEAMKKLKDMGVDAQNKIEGPKRGVSSLEVLFAHCWRHVTEARMLPDDQELSFVVVADMRRTRPNTNVPPQVPENFFGNAITWTCAKSTPHTLRNETFAATLAHIAKLVDDCVHPNNLHGMIHCFELFDTRSQDESLWFGGVNINVASSPRFPIHLVDFGWGPPTCARPICASCDGEICLLPCSSNGVDVCIKLDALSLERLIDDPTFIFP